MVTLVPWRAQHLLANSAGPRRTVELRGSRIRLLRAARHTMYVTSIDFSELPLYGARRWALSLRWRPGAPALQNDIDGTEHAIAPSLGRDWPPARGSCTFLQHPCHPAVAPSTTHQTHKSERTMQRFPAVSSAFPEVLVLDQCVEMGVSCPSTASSSRRTFCATNSRGAAVEEPTACGKLRYRQTVPTNFTRRLQSQISPVTQSHLRIRHFGATNPRPTPTLFQSLAFRGCLFKGSRTRQFAEKQRQTQGPYNPAAELESVAS